MCGRYVSTRSPQDLVQLFQVTDWRAEEALAPNWNVAPTNNVWAVLERVPREKTDATAVERELRPLRWGLVPSWAKDVNIGARMINARVETVHEKPAYRRAFAKHRCLLPTDGFYEWEQAKDPDTGKARKQPYFIHPEDQQVMALAGLYEYWRNPEVKQDDDPAAWLTTCPPEPTARRREGAPEPHTDERAESRAAGPSRIPDDCASCSSRISTRRAGRT